MKIIPPLLAVLLLTLNLAFADNAERDSLLMKARDSSALDVLSSYQHSQMMLMYAELAQKGLTIQSPEGKISKRKAKKLAKEHQLKVEVLEQVMSERGFQDLEGDYTFAIKGDCEGAKAWWAVLGASEDCQDPMIRQDDMEVTVVHPCTREGDSFDWETTGTTFDDAVIFVEELNSDFLYFGVIKGGVIRLHLDAERALASWPSFEKPPSLAALKSCEITMARKAEPITSEK
jgi:hypothetical protein